MQPITATLLAGLALAASAAAHAQETAATPAAVEPAQAAVPGAPPPVATGEGIRLDFEGGNVLVSTGAEFTQATPGQALMPGERVLVAEGGAATLGYADGCRKALSTPGVYTVTPECSLAAATRTGPSPKAIAGIAGGVAAIAAVAGGGGGNERSPPVSR